MAGRLQSYQRRHPHPFPDPDLTLQGKPTERRASAPEGENIRIVIDDVDSGLQAGEVQEPRQRRLILQRDKSDTSCRTRGFGMRLMGGKRGHDGRLYAVVSWVLLGSSADIAGLQKGTAPPGNKKKEQPSPFECCLSTSK